MQQNLHRDICTTIVFCTTHTAFVDNYEKATKQIGTCR